MKLVVKLVNARGCTSRSGRRVQWTTPMPPRVCSRGAANNRINVDIVVIRSVFPNSSTWSRLCIASCAIAVASSSCSKRWSAEDDAGSKRSSVRFGSSTNATSSEGSAPRWSRMRRGGRKSVCGRRTYSVTCVSPQLEPTRERRRDCWRSPCPELPPRLECTAAADVARNRSATDAESRRWQHPAWC